MKLLIHSGCHKKGYLDKKTLICSGCGNKPEGEKVILIKRNKEEKVEKIKYDPNMIRMWHEINNPGLFQERKGYGYPRV